jgi:hypothetical protein
MFHLEFSRKQSGRQPRIRRDAIYIAPSGVEYPVRVVEVDMKDQSARIEWEWTPGKFIRMWVGTADVSGLGVRR